MNRHFIVSFFAIIVFATSARADVSLPQGGLYKPTFLLDDRSFAAGSSFISEITFERRKIPLLIMCHHVLANSSAEIRSAIALSMTVPPQTLIAPEMLSISGARSVDNSGADGDVAVFILAKPLGKTPCLKLSSTVPKVGDRVALYSRIFQTTEPKLYRGTVVAVSDRSLEYMLDDPGIELGGSSGSPVLAEKGEVIGINVSGRTVGGRLHVSANPTFVFLPKLLSALKARSSSPTPIDRHKR